MVPKDWQHPKDSSGDYIPLFQDDDLMEDGDWFQMYETTTEGTSISPVIDTEENLARWLTDNRASACGSMTATYEEWLRMIKVGWAPSFVMFNGNLKSGVSIS
jgi:hypothetical protein